MQAQLYNNISKIFLYHNRGSVFMKWTAHFCTITKHKILVMKYCFCVGLYRQGLLHDLSKYSPTEFLVGAKYYQGTRSPNNAEKEKKGYSSSWLHHKGRNKHHFEYWLDYSGKKEPIFVGMKMPVCYVVEMFLDRIAACKTYQKEKYTQKSPLLYYENSKAYHVMYPSSQKLLEKLLHILAEQGEQKAFCYARKLIKQQRKNDIKKFLYTHGIKKYCK